MNRSTPGLPVHHQLYLYTFPHQKIIFISLGFHHSCPQRCAERIYGISTANENVVLVLGFWTQAWGTKAVCMFVCVCVWLEKGLGKGPPGLNFSSMSNARSCPDWLFLPCINMFLSNLAWGWPLVSFLPVKDLSWGISETHLPLKHSSYAKWRKKRCKFQRRVPANI